MKRGKTIVDEVTRATVLPLRIETTLASFKASVEAYVVAAFDGWRGKPRMPADTQSTAPWNAIERLGCLRVNWLRFKTRLARFGENEILCTCGAHVLSAFLIRDRWSLIVLGRQSLVKPPSELLPVRTKTLETLARILPELDNGESAKSFPGGGGSGGDGGASPAELGIPIRWGRGLN